MRDHFQSLGVALLGDVVAGRAIRRRDAVALARMVLESAAVRAAESLLEADYAELLPRLTALLEEVLAQARERDSDQKGYRAIYKIEGSTAKLVRVLEVNKHEY